MARKKGPTPKRAVQHPQRKFDKPGLPGRALLAALVVGSLLVVGGVIAFARTVPTPMADRPTLALCTFMV